MPVVQNHHVAGLARRMIRTGYASKAQPVDVPESSPKRLSTGPGRTGTAGA